MRVCEDFLLKEIAGDYMLIPVGERYADFAAMISLNETGAFLWELMTNECTVEQLVQALVSEYDTDSAAAQADVLEFVNMLREHSMLKE